ncbi:hypothetical protein [Mycobacterium sp.]|uniref:hypothetical protein n=1 Tax=Mycobacterium sp. TaxID=1785 RepID=UPI002C3F2D48|nr:hypothetical protein [Mycobacterium sp.]HTY35423.1 hypothetical protein [Mycobacterium sp.]
MSLDLTGILDGLVSHASATGYFQRVNTHEPKSAPGWGLTCAIWAQEIAPLPAASGLAATSTLVTFSLRIYTDMLQEPLDQIDPKVLAATDVLMEAYSGNFTLGGTVRDIDLLGQFGRGLNAEAGYINLNQKQLRCMTINVPLVVNDQFPQAP